jgi:hypothetical protein
MQPAKKAAINPDSQESCGSLFALLGRNFSRKPLLNQYISGAPESQQETSLTPERRQADP